MINRYLDKYLNIILNMQILFDFFGDKRKNLLHSRMQRRAGRPAAPLQRRFVQPPVLATLSKDSKIFLDDL
jgi:hypothetical protein